MEPFGYFKAGPFGWTDCAETDEGAQPLFDQSAIDALEKQRDELRAALEFYADGHHFILHDANAWETVSGEPPNFQEDEANTATVEDGSVARAAIASVKGGACKHCNGKGVSQISDPCICQYGKKGGAA